MTEVSEQSVSFEQSTVRSTRGVSIAVRRWMPANGETRAEVLILHGYAEHGERYRHLAHHLARRGIASRALDLRGHGESSGPRGHVVRFVDYHDDVDAMLTTPATEAPRFIIAHSMGALLALDYVAARGASGLSGLVVTNPYLALAMEVPPLKLWVSEALATLLPRLPVPSGLDPAGLTHDEKVVRAYQRDPRIFSTATPGWFRESTRAQERVRGLRQIDVPLLYVYSDADPIAAPDANRALAEQLQSPDKTVLLRSGELHEVLNELDHESLFETISDWLVARL